MLNPKIGGIHHITAVASSAAENLSFYREGLGLRLVKKTVNFDDPHTYHLYYGDGSGTPGTIMTFFPWQDLPAGQAGAGMVVATAFSIPRAAVSYWMARLGGMGIATAGSERFGEPVIRFRDPHGLPLELVGVNEPAAATAWTSGGVSARNAICGFHSATALANEAGPTEGLLCDVMGMRPWGREGRRRRFDISDGTAPGRFFDLVVDPAAARGRPGGGTVHHIAFRTPSGGEQGLWRERLMQTGVAVTPVRDRSYFKSIYFHEPAGVLFEIATDPPGFTVDEPLEQLGRALKLPRQFEPLRRQIELSLPPLGPAEPDASPSRAKVVAA